VDLKLRRPGKFTELVAYHLFGDVDRNEIFSIVYSKCEADKFRWNIAIARPRLDDLLVTSFRHLQHLFQELLVDIGTFFERTGHK